MTIIISILVFKNHFKFVKLIYLKFSLSQQPADVKKQTDFELQTADVWSTSSAVEACRCGPQTADVLTSEKQTAPNIPHDEGNKLMSNIKELRII